MSKKTAKTKKTELKPKLVEKNWHPYKDVFMIEVMPVFFKKPKKEKQPDGTFKTTEFGGVKCEVGAEEIWTSKIAIRTRPDGKHYIPVPKKGDVLVVPKDKVNATNQNGEKVPVTKFLGITE